MKLEGSLKKEAHKPNISGGEQKATAAKLSTVIEKVVNVRRKAFCGHVSSILRPVDLTID